MSIGQKILMSIAVLVLVSMMLFIAFGSKGISDVLQLRRDDAAIKKSNDRLIMENLTLRREVERLRHDKSYIAHVAREELGLTGPDDIIIRVHPGKGGGDE